MHKIESFIYISHFLSRFGKIGYVCVLNSIVCKQVYNRLETIEFVHTTPMNLSNEKNDANEGKKTRTTICCNLHRHTH